MVDKLTVLVPCKDEETNIGPCLESVREVADEILVADSGSTDRTLQIVTRYAKARVIRREYVDSGNFKNWAIPQASHPWVFVLDADERMTAPLTAELRSLLARPASRLGYWVYRNNHFMGHPVRGTSWGRDKVIRLFRREAGHYLEYTDHTEVDLDRKLVGTLRGRLEHYTCWTYEDFFQKMHRYTQQQAMLWHRQGRRANIFRLATAAPARFIREFILLSGYRDGAVGLQIATLSACYAFMKQARLWHLQHGRAADGIADCLDKPRRETNDQPLRHAASDPPAVAATPPSKPLPV